MSCIIGSFYNPFLSAAAGDAYMNFDKWFDIICVTIRKEDGSETWWRREPTGYKFWRSVEAAEAFMVPAPSSEFEWWTESEDQAVAWTV